MPCPYDSLQKAIDSKPFLSLLYYSPCMHLWVIMCGCVAQHFLQRFPPGADRFAGVDHFEVANGSPALSEAIAHIECKVKSRMETNDHWITYAEVTSGGLTDADAKTAVHRRKVANYY